MERLLRRVWYWLRRRRFDADLAEELAFHREMTERRLATDGVPPDEAKLAARRTLGSTALAHDHAHDVWVPPALQGIGQDVRFAVRLLIKDAWFTVTIVLTLGLGLGGAGTLFAIVNGMALRGLPVDDPAAIVAVHARDAHGRPLRLSLAQFRDWRDASRRVVSLAADEPAGMTITDKGLAPRQVAGAYVSANAFSVLHQHPILGRDFRVEDDHPGAPRVVMLSRALWKTRYGADPAIVGRTLTINARPAVVIGVMPKGFAFPLIEQVWQPLADAPHLDVQKRDVRTLAVFGRLEAGVTERRARAVLDVVARRLGREYPKTDRGLSASVEPYTGGLGGPRNPWVDGLGAAVFLLLIGCANAANLLQARSSSRSREIAIRASLGASRWRVVRQLLVESVLLAAVAAVVGLGLTRAGLAIWVGSLPQAHWPYWYRWTIDGRVVAFLAIVSAATAVIFGLAPALHLARTRAQDLMRDGGQALGAGVHGRRWMNLVLAGELALTLVLLAGAGLMIRSTVQLLRADSLVHARHVLMAGVNLPFARYRTAQQRVAFFSTLARRAEADPDVTAFAVATAMPFYTAPIRSIAIAGYPELAGDRRPHASYVAVGRNYFHTLGVHLLRGRTFTSADGTAGHLTAIVNQQFVAEYLDDLNPLSAHIRISDPNAPEAASSWLSIIGVAPTIRQHYGQNLDPVVYVPYRQDPEHAAALFVRTTGKPEAVAPSLRDIVRELNPALPLYNVSALSSFLQNTRFANRVFLTVLAACGLFALLLSALGLYASTVYAVTRRIPEIGLRVALGAGRRQVVWLFLRQTLRLMLWGGIGGLAAAIAATRVIRGILVHTSPTDAGTLVATTVLLIGVAVLATWWPARRAARLDSVAALRHE